MTLQPLAAVAIVVFLGGSSAAFGRPTIEELQARTVLDDYEANVLFGYRIVTDTRRFASRYDGNALNCSSCHLRGGTVEDALPLNVAGIYPKWRARNGISNGIGLRIRECFLYSQNGIMPPEDAAEVQAVAAYINYLSEGEVVGRIPKGRGVPGLPGTGEDPNPARGEAVYRRGCVACHGENGEGNAQGPPLWGSDSYNAGAGLHNVPRLAGFVWANMPPGKTRSLSHQEAFDVAAYIHLQQRPFDPRQGRLKQLAGRIYDWLLHLTGTSRR